MARHPQRRVGAKARLAACALGAFAWLGAVGAGAETAASLHDPWQGLNRGLFALNQGLDTVLTGPIAHGYRFIVPGVIRDRVSAGVDNISEPTTVINDVLQGRPRPAVRATGRFLINSTLGVGGLFDVATGWGLAAHSSDFGQTLGRYGVKPGPYIYVPIFGPSDLRDGVGRIADVFGDPINFATGSFLSTPGAARFGAVALDTRVRADPALKALKDATDPYVTARSAYAQHRDAVVHEALGQAQALPDFN